MAHGMQSSGGAGTANRTVRPARLDTRARRRRRSPCGRATRPTPCARESRWRSGSAPRSRSSFAAARNRRRRDAMDRSRTGLRCAPVTARPPGIDQGRLAGHEASPARQPTLDQIDECPVDLDSHPSPAKLVCGQQRRSGSRVGVQHDTALATGDGHTLPSQGQGHHGRMVVGLPVQALERLRRNLPYGTQPAPAGAAYRLDVVVVVLASWKTGRRFRVPSWGGPARIPGARSVCSR